MKNHLPPNWQQPDLTDLPDSVWVIPPIVDLCGRLREPGHQSHGTLASEGAAARANGILHVVMPPDTNPVLENGSLLKGLRERAYADGGIHLHLLGALTAGLEGKQPANLAGLKQGGAIGVSNAWAGFDNDLVMLRTLEYAKTFHLKVFFYPNEPALSSGGVAHEGYIASYHGLAGIPWLAETVALAKQILMVEETGVSAHFGQLTCRTSVDLIRFGKSRGLPITCDVAMHQLHLTDDDIIGYNANAYVLPPLRSNTDQKALIDGLKDGTIDAICSHHEPLSSSSKQAPFAECAAGISNFDTFVALGCKLVADGILTSEELVQKICLNPALIVGIDYERIGGAVVIDPNQAWTVRNDTMLSAGKNTSFMGRELVGKTIQVLP